MPANAGKVGGGMTQQFYFVCTKCEAKFFKPYDSAVCPRCGNEVHSTEKLNPPWEEQHATAQRRAEIFLFAKGMHPMREPLLVRALTAYFLKGGNLC